MFFLVLIVLQPSHSLFTSLLLYAFSTLVGLKLSFCWTVPSFLLYFNKFPLNSVSLCKRVCTSLFSLLSMIELYSRALYLSIHFCKYLCFFFYFFLSPCIILFILHLFYELYILFIFYIFLLLYDNLSFHP